jgi:hypothetical protein
MIIKKKGKVLCLGCYNKESPVVDEGERIVKEVIDHLIVWEDTNGLERVRQRIQSHRDTMRREEMSIKK